MGWLRGLSRGSGEVAAEALRKTAAARGFDVVANAQIGVPGRFRGAIRAIRYRPLTAIPVFEVELWDGSGRLILQWLGRREIIGLQCGAKISVEGRVADGPDGLPMIYNPRYTLLGAND